MPNYFYTAKSFDGEQKTGNVFAKDINQLSQILKTENAFLIEAVPEEEHKKAKGKISINLFGVSATEKIMMTRNLWIMFGSGLSLVKIFDILSRQAKNQKLKNTMIQINGMLNRGEAFSDSLAKFPKVFNDFFVSMVRIGEESGTLESVFEILSTHMDREHELKTKIRGALIYPCIILVVMGGIGVVVSIFVLPKFNSFLMGMNI